MSAPNKAGWWWRLWGSDYEHATPTEVYWHMGPDFTGWAFSDDGDEPVDGYRWGGPVERGPSPEVAELRERLDAHEEAATRLVCVATGASGAILCFSSGGTDRPPKGYHYIVGGPNTSYTLPEVGEGVAREVDK